MARAKITDIRKAIGFPADLVERIKRYRFAREFPTEAEAIRALIEAGLAAEGFAFKRPNDET